MNVPSASEILQRLHGAAGASGLTGALLWDVERYFEARGDEARARWMHFERHGYEARTEAAALQELLCAGSSQELVDAVMGKVRALDQQAWVHGGIER